MTLRRYLRLYRLFLAHNLKRLLHHRADLVIGMAGFLVLQASGIGMLYLVFARIPTIAGWTFDEVLFVYGFAQIPRGLDHLLTDNLWALADRIIDKGEFDRYLLVPVHPLFHLIAETIQPDALGEIALGGILVVVAGIRLGLEPTLPDALAFIFFVFLGTVLYASIKLFFASLAFWMKRSMSLLYLAYMFSNLARYPLDVYGTGFRRLLVYGLPFAFTATVPASFFLGRVSPGSALVGTMIAATASATLALIVFHRGIAAYEGTGS
jgi:ABC-2 type transport system permease protein